MSGGKNLVKPEKQARYDYEWTYRQQLLDKALRLEASGTYLQSVWRAPLELGLNRTVPVFCEELCGRASGTRR
jgi:hypothetical protein